MGHLRIDLPSQVIPYDPLHQSSIHGVSLVNGAITFLSSALFIELISSEWVMVDLG